MIITHYGHRLPADYDLDRIRARVQQRGPVWDQAPDLLFKAFLLRQRGHHGAAADHFSSLYLWPDDQALRDWLGRGGYRVVTDSFGRAPIDSALTLDACRGPADDARFLYREDVAIPADADLTAVLAAETAGNRQRAAGPAVVAALAGVVVATWTLLRVVVSAAPPPAGAGGVAYEILHLSRPGLDRLPAAERPPAA